MTDELDLPQHDKVHIEFTEAVGGSTSAIMPLCEILNGNVSEVDEKKKTLTIVNVLDGKEVERPFSGKEFLKQVEETLAIKKIKSIKLQKAHTPEIIDL